jgi:hypothetical protein
MWIEKLGLAALLMGSPVLTAMENGSAGAAGLGEYPRNLFNIPEGEEASEAPGPRHEAVEEADKENRPPAAFPETAGMASRAPQESRLDGILENRYPCSIVLSLPNCQDNADGSLLMHLNGLAYFLGPKGIGHFLLEPMDRVGFQVLGEGGRARRDKVVEILIANGPAVTLRVRPRPMGAESADIAMAGAGR